MTELPSGTITFLFTDIEGSTRLWEEHPEAMRGALARHDEILRDVVATEGGHVFKTVGDAFCVAFQVASQAAAAACEAQRALKDDSTPALGPLPVRMALYTGEAEARDNDYFGQALNRCARILDAAHGGQVIISQTTASGLLEEALPEGLCLGSLGQHRLRDLVQPEELFQLSHADLPSEFPPLRSLAAFTHNLPAQVTELIGREEDVAEVRARLGETRLVTLTGAGGAGKTRLALQVGAELLGAYPDGVWFIELAAISDASLLPQAILSTLGIREQPQKSLLAAAVDSLQGKRVLLILDNCEHLVDACAEVAAAVLAACADASVLATSREALRAEGEVLWRVPSLSVPERAGDADLPVATLTQFAATRLFIERAGAVKPGFTVTDDNAPTVAEICLRLDGIPLAIELAAARINVLSPEQIEERLDDRFRLLTGGRRTALPRHQTLRAAVEWGYELLSDQERQLFDRLSVFTGGFTLEAAEAVCVGDSVAEADVLDLVDGLMSKSLVAPQEAGHGTRYRMLASLRVYGQERLAGAGETDAVRRRYAEHWLAFVDAAGPGITGPDQAVWLRRLATDHDNLREALAWALEADIDLGCRLVNGLTRFWDVRCHWAEGREWLGRYVATPGMADPRIKADGLNSLGMFAARQGDVDEAVELCKRSLETAKAAGYLPGIGHAMGSLGFIAHDQGEFETAVDRYKESLGIRRQTGDHYGEARSLHGLGTVAHGQADHATAQRRYKESLKISRRIGDSSGIALTLGNLGNLAREQGRIEEARALLEESLEIRNGLGDLHGVAGMLGTLGLVAHQEGDVGAARTHMEGAAATFRQLGASVHLAHYLNNLGLLAHERHDYEDSMRFQQEALSIRQRLGDQAGIAQSTGNLGLLASSMGQHDRAEALCQEALSLYGRIGDHRGSTVTLQQLGVVELAREGYDAAQTWLAKCVGDAHALGLLGVVAEALYWLGKAAAGQNQGARAAALYGACAARQAAMGVPSPLEKDDSDFGDTRDQMTTPAFDQAWAEGLAMTLDEAVAYALGRAADG